MKSSMRKMSFALLASTFLAPASTLAVTKLGTLNFDVTDLPDHPLGYACFPHGINSSGVIVGTCEHRGATTGILTSGFILSNGIFIDVTGPAPACGGVVYRYASIADINDSGSYLRRHSYHCQEQEGLSGGETVMVVGEGGRVLSAELTPQYLPPEIGATGINDAGVAVGYVYFNDYRPSPVQPAIWTSSMATTLDVPELSYGSWSAFDINAAGQILIQADVSDGRSASDRIAAYIYTDGTLQEITFPGYSYTDNQLVFPSNINNDGSVVGVFLDPRTNTYKGFLFAHNVFYPIDLSGYLTASLSGIANDGTIVGLGITSGGTYKNFVIRPRIDTDGDGLLDTWETSGITTTDGFLNLPAMGADP